MDEPAGDRQPTGRKKLPEEAWALTPLSHGRRSALAPVRFPTVRFAKQPPAATAATV
jgi:hypothetical protein